MAFGAGPFGGGGGGIVSGLVETPTSLLLTFDVAPRAISHTDVQDALRAANWSLEPITPYGAFTPRIQWVDRVDAFVLRVLLDAVPVESALYEGSFADSVVPSSPSASFGCRCFKFVASAPAFQPPKSRAAQRKERITDIANPFTPSDAGSPNAALSTFQVTSSGDYALDRGPVGLRKRLWRRLVSQPGAFYHLPKQYGLQWKEKGAVRPADLYELQLRAQQQALAEPDVVRASVTVVRLADAPNVVWLKLKAESNTGETAEINQPFELQG